MISDAPLTSTIDLPPLSSLSCSLAFRSSSIWRAFCRNLSTCGGDAVVRTLDTKMPLWRRWFHAPGLQEGQKWDVHCATLLFLLSVDQQIPKKTQGFLLSTIPGRFWPIQRKCQVPLSLRMKLCLWFLICVAKNFSPDVELVKKSWVGYESILVNFRFPFQSIPLAVINVETKQSFYGRPEVTGLYHTQVILIMAPEIEHQNWTLLCVYRGNCSQILTIDTLWLAREFKLWLMFSTTVYRWLSARLQ